MQAAALAVAQIEAEKGGELTPDEIEKKAA